MVREVSTVKFKEAGEFLYFLLRKKNYNTFDALLRIAGALHVPSNALSCAGNKDKQAITEQVCSIRGVSRERLESVVLQDIVAEFLGFGDEPVHLGELEGNKFKVTVRNIVSLPVISPRFRNLFGSQRFSKNNVGIGRAIIKRDFKGAVELISQEPKFAAKIQAHLRSNDFVGALRNIHRKILVMYVHAYQSFIWNKAALLTDRDVLPVVGFGTEFIDEATQSVLDEEGVKLSDFVVRQLPEVSSEGAVRDVWVEVKDLKVGVLEDDSHSGKKMVALEFFLPKGCYATEFVRQNFQ